MAHANNPFLQGADPNDPSNRYPQILSSVTGQPLSSPQQSQQFTGYPQQQQQLQPQQQNSNFYGGGGGGYINPQPTGQPFRPASSFGQQLEAQINYTGVSGSSGYSQGSGSGIAAGSNYTGGGQGIARLQTGQPSYQAVSAFDPYSSLSQLPWAQPQQPSQPQSQSTNPTSPTSSSTHADHPRSFVNAHRTQLEAWDTYTWKQFLNSVTGLKEAWETRARIVMKATAEYNQAWSPADQQRCQQLLSEAESNIDGIAASEFQLKEVESGYRHSSDAASRQRVREALNAGLKSLPEWPEELQTTSGMTVGYGGGGGGGYDGGQQGFGGQAPGGQGFTPQQRQFQQQQQQAQFQPQQQPQYQQQGPQFQQQQPQFQQQQPSYLNAPYQNPNPTGWGMTPQFTGFR